MLCSVRMRLTRGDRLGSILCLHRTLCRLLSQSDSSQLFAWHPRPNTPTRTGPGQGKCRRCKGHAFALMKILPATSPRPAIARIPHPSTAARADSINARSYQDPATCDFCELLSAASGTAGRARMRNANRPEKRPNAERRDEEEETADADPEEMWGVRVPPRQRRRLQKIQRAGTQF